MDYDWRKTIDDLNQGDHITIMEVLDDPNKTEVSSFFGTSTVESLPHQQAKMFVGIVMKVGAINLPFVGVTAVDKRVQGEQRKIPLSLDIRFIRVMKLSNGYADFFSGESEFQIKQTTEKEKNPWSQGSGGGANGF